MSEATDLRDYVKSQFRTQLVLETVEHDDETATSLDSGSDARLDEKTAEAIDWFEMEFAPYDPTNHTIHKRIAAYITLWLLFEDNEDDDKAARFAKKANDMIESFKQKKRVAPLAASGYVRSTAPVTRPMFDQEVFEDYIPPNNSTTDEDA